MSKTTEPQDIWHHFWFWRIVLWVVAGCAILGVAESVYFCFLNNILLVRVAIGVLPCILLMMLFSHFMLSHLEKRQETNKRTFLNTPGSMIWLCMYVPEATDFECAILYGDVDSPSRIEMFKENYIGCHPVVYTADKEGRMHRDGSSLWVDHRLHDL